MAGIFSWTGAIGFVPFFAIEHVNIEHVIIYKYRPYNQGINLVIFIKFIVGLQY